MTGATERSAPVAAHGSVTPAGRWRRHRSTALIAAALVLAVALAVATSGGPERSQAHDPDNPGPDGAQAVARVLADEGVEVRVVRSADELDDARSERAGSGARGDTTLVVTTSAALGRSTVDRLLDDALESRIVVVNPSSLLLDALGIGGSPTALDADGPVAADCTDPLFDGLEIEVDTSEALPIPGCFSDALASEGQLTLLGAGRLLANDQVLRADNAAVVLRLLGENPRLIWYVASSDDLGADDGVSIGSLLPPWIMPGLWLLLLATLGLVGWRVRRLGPLASEPLPVVVKAIETTLSRGRLYRHAGDRAHAAAALRRAARERSASRLRLDAGADQPTVVAAVARHVGRPTTEVAALLGDDAPAPDSDRALITLATDVAALEEEVRRS